MGGIGEHLARVFFIIIAVVVFLSVGLTYGAVRVWDYYRTPEATTIAQQTQSPVPAPSPTPTNSKWQEEPCGVNKIEGKCLVLTDEKSRIKIYLAKDAERVVILLPNLTSSGKTIPLQFALYPITMWSGDSVGEIIPPKQAQFSLDQRAVLLKDYDAIVRRAVRDSGVIAFSFKIEIGGKALPQLFGVEFNLPLPIPPEYLPGEAKGFGKLGSSQLAAD